jgi:hypothetical protein
MASFTHNIYFTPRFTRMSLFILPMHHSSKIPLSFHVNVHTIYFRSSQSFLQYYHLSLNSFFCFCRPLCVHFFTSLLFFSFPSLSAFPSYTTFLSSFLSSCSIYLFLFDKLLTFHIYLLLNYFYFSPLIFHFLPPIQSFFLLTISMFCLKLAPNINTRCLQNTVYHKRTTCNVRTSNPQSSQL